MNEYQYKLKSPYRTKIMTGTINAESADAARCHAAEHLGDHRHADYMTIKLLHKDIPTPAG